MNGSITITEAALASLIGLTAHEVPGVVGMAPATFKEGISRVLGRAQSRNGVVLSKDGNRYSAELYVVLAFGVSIPTVAANIAERVEHAVRTLAGTELSDVKVHAVGVSRG